MKQYVYFLDKFLHVWHENLGQQWDHVRLFDRLQIMLHHGHRDISKHIGGEPSVAVQ